SLPSQLAAAVRTTSGGTNRRSDPAPDLGRTNTHGRESSQWYWSGSAQALQRQRHVWAGVSVWSWPRSPFWVGIQRRREIARWTVVGVGVEPVGGRLDQLVAKTTDAPPAAGIDAAGLVCGPVGVGGGAATGRAHVQCHGHAEIGRAHV